MLPTGSRSSHQIVSEVSIASVVCRHELAKTFQTMGRHRDLWLEYREQQGEEVFGRVAAALRVDPARLPARKGAPEKVRAAALMRATTRISNGWPASCRWENPRRSASICGASGWPEKIKPANSDTFCQ